MFADQQETGRSQRAASLKGSASCSLLAAPRFQAVDDIKASMAAKRAQARQQRAAHKAVAGPSAPARVRRSARVEGKPAPNYNENAMILALADGNVADKHDRRLLKGEPLGPLTAVGCTDSWLQAVGALLPADGMPS